MFNVRQIAEKSKFLQKYASIIWYNISLKELTSFKIGGNAAFYIKPHSSEDLQAVLNFVHEEHIPALLLGGGTNMLIPDEGICGAVIHTGALKHITIEEKDGSPLLRVQAGVLMQDLTAFCAAHALTGFEDFAGLPGTVGGAAFMNARCYETSISQVLDFASVLVCTEQGYGMQQYTMSAADWDYKKSPFQPMTGNHAAVHAQRPVIESLVFHAAYGVREEIEKKMQERLTDRMNKGHFTLPSAGSTFKNNHLFGKPSGKLIEEAGLRGLQIGGAQVAPWHGNLVVNTGNATAKDVCAVIEAVQKRVKEQTGFLLEPEVIIASV